MAHRLDSYFDRMNDSILLHYQLYSHFRGKQLTDQEEHVQLSSVSPSIGSLACFPIFEWSGRKLCANTRLGQLTSICSGCQISRSILLTAHQLASNLSTPLEASEPTFTDMSTHGPVNSRTSNTEVDPATCQL